MGARSTRMVAVLLVGCMTLTGCATAQPAQPAAPRFNPGRFIEMLNKIDLGLKRDQAAGATVTRETDVNFTYVMALCKDVLVGFDRQAQVLSWFQFGIAIVGAVAGGIIGPYFAAIDAAKHAGIITAMSGTAGVANTAQQSLGHYALSNDAYREARHDLRVQVLDALASYKGTDVQKKADAVAKAYIACMLLPGATAQGQ